MPLVGSPVVKVVHCSFVTIEPKELVAVIVAIDVPVGVVTVPVTSPLVSVSPLGIAGLQATDIDVSPDRNALKSTYTTSPLIFIRLVEGDTTIGFAVGTSDTL